jgi:uncharacterized surface protein with fasciclin (FAS1) repeats
MMKMKYLHKLLCLLLGTIVLFSLSCKQETASPTQVLGTNNGATLINIIKNDKQYSILYTALLSTNLADPLGIYGNMTLFAPTNDAFKLYFKRKGIADITKVNADTLKNLLKYHIYNEQYGSAYFVMGTLPTPTINGNYIRFDISAGLSKTKLNGSVTINQLDVIGSNGVLHSINDVLEPPSQNLYDWLKARPEYSVMLEAFDKTGNSDEILKKVETDPTIVRYGQPQMKWRTLFLETNTVLKNAGINSFDDLAKKYSNTYTTTKSYTNMADSLNMFVRFHALNQKYFISDFGDVFKESYATGNFLIFNSTGGLSINKHIDDASKLQVKVGLDVPNSNNLAINGVVNSVSSVLSLYKVRPITVIQKFAGEPADRVIILPNGTISDFTTQFPKYPNDPTDQALFKWIKWGYPVGTTSPPTARGEWSGDLTVGLTGVLQGFWIELTTPLVFPGSYNVYLNYSGLRRSTAANVNYASFNFDGKQLGDLVSLNLNDNLDALGGSTVGPTPTGVTTYFNDYQYRRFIGKVTLSTTNTHVFRMDMLPASNVTGMWWYNIELVPVP